MTPGTLWSKEDIEKVRQMHFDGASDKVIGLEVGRSTDSVFAIREKHDIFRGQKPTRINLNKNPVFEKQLNNAKACTLHLIDLMREYGNTGCTLAEAKAEYQAANELDVPESYQYRTVMPVIEARSYMGSHFADVPR